MGLAHFSYVEIAFEITRVARSRLVGEPSGEEIDRDCRHHHERAAEDRHRKGDEPGERPPPSSRHEGQQPRFAPRLCGFDFGRGYAGPVKVKLRNPDRVVEVSGPSTVAGMLEKLQIVPEAVLVIRDATLLTRDERLGEDDEIEVRPVLSGGSK